MPCLIVLLLSVTFQDAASRPQQPGVQATGEGRPNPAQAGAARGLGAARAADVVALRNVLLELGPPLPESGTIQVRGRIANFRVVRREQLPNGTVRAEAEIELPLEEGKLERLRVDVDERPISGQDVMGGAADAGEGPELQMTGADASPLATRAGSAEAQLQTNYRQTRGTSPTGDLGEATTRYLNNARALDREIGFYRAQLVDLARQEQSARGARERERIVQLRTNAAVALADAWHQRCVLEHDAEQEMRANAGGMSEHNPSER